MIIAHIHCDECNKILCSIDENAVDEALGSIESAASDYTYVDGDDDEHILCPDCREDAKERNPNEDENQYKIAKGL